MFNQQLLEWFIPQIEKEIISYVKPLELQKSPEISITRQEIFDKFLNMCVHHIKYTVPGSYYPSVWFESRDCYLRLPKEQYDHMFKLVVNGKIYLDDEGKVQYNDE